MKYFKESSPNVSNRVVVSPVASGNTLEINGGFHASSFKHTDFEGVMDPLIMVDHYTMTKPTFGAHPHAGLSAVSLILEDSEGTFHNRDSLGNDFDLKPGDLYWLKAGSGVVHDEAPRQNASIHGLQVFVNIPALDKQSAPSSLHVVAEKMPIIASEGYRVRVALGEHHGVKGAVSPSVPMTILDGTLSVNGGYTVHVRKDHHVWLTALSGDIAIHVNKQRIEVNAGEAVAIANEMNAVLDIELRNTSNEQATFALFEAQPLKEAFIQNGPLVAANQKAMQRVQANLVAGTFGGIRNNGEVA